MSEEAVCYGSLLNLCYRWSTRRYECPTECCWIHLCKYVIW